MLDRLRALSYIGACALLAACPRRPPEPLLPRALAPAPHDSAVAWARTTAPRTPALIRFRWRYQDERVRYAGRGTARIAPPDSLRFDFAGPLGLGSGAAVVIGDSLAWAEPEKSFRSLVPAIPMLWAALGIVQAPDADMAVFGAADSVADRRRALWRFARADDTLTYVATAPLADSLAAASGSAGARGAGAGETRDQGGAGAARWLEAEWRRRGEVIARSRSQLDARGRPAHARVDFPEGPARFELQVVAVDTMAVMPPALWRGRRG